MMNWSAAQAGCGEAGALLLRFYTERGPFPRGRGEIPDNAIDYVARQVGVPTMTWYLTATWRSRLVRWAVVAVHELRTEASDLVDATARVSRRQAHIGDDQQVVGKLAAWAIGLHPRVDLLAQVRFEPGEVSLWVLGGVFAVFGLNDRIAVPDRAVIAAAAQSIRPSKVASRPPSGPEPHT